MKASHAFDGWKFLIQFTTPIAEHRFLEITLLSSALLLGSLSRPLQGSSDALSVDLCSCMD